MKKILVVEDNLDFGECLKALFESDQIQVLLAENGAEALIILRDTDVDAVLSDIDMPVKNGIELLKEFRQFNKKTPVYMMRRYF